jgi:deferrochelatase/peroxidase EfeB
VTDPIWPALPPANVDADEYKKTYAGQLARQRYLHIVTANVFVSTRTELADLLEALSWYAHHQMTRVPSILTQRPYDPPLENRRVTVTVGYGATLFTNFAGDDRFGWASLKPNWLKVIPPLEGDDPGFSPREYASDLVFLLASDDAYINEYLFGLLYYGNVHRGIRVQNLERGYTRPDTREPGGFEDGSSNPRGGAPNSSMNRFVYIDQGDDEPEWCEHGTYLAYRKIQRRLSKFFTLTLKEQEALMGADKGTGDRISGAPPPCHKYKMNPKRKMLDLFGLNDDDRQILRRPYFYDDGLDSAGHELRGVHHLSFAKNLTRQYEWRVQMWEMNSNFPVPNAGTDLLYSPHGGASNVGGGYYFIPGKLDQRLCSPTE